MEKKERLKQPTVDKAFWDMLLRDRVIDTAAADPRVTESVRSLLIRDLVDEGAETVADEQQAYKDLVTSLKAWYGLNEDQAVQAMNRCENNLQVEENT